MSSSVVKPIESSRSGPCSVINRLLSFNTLLVLSYRVQWVLVL
jgi:hypothetical protein